VRISDTLFECTNLQKNILKYAFGTNTKQMTAGMESSENNNATLVINFKKGRAVK
jgi:hypothetical protein